jgi:predicted MFS family arabinose efflux permease
MEAGKQTAAQEWRANWTIVMAAMAGLSFASIPHATIGFFMDPLRDEFGWSATGITAGLTIFSVVTLLFTAVGGAIVDRYGARWVGVAGIALCGLSFAAFAFNTGAVWLWLLLWTVYSFSAVGIRTTVWNSAVSSVFDTSRGLALALVLSGLALASIFAPPIARWLIDEQGWRTAYAGIGLGWGGLGFLLVLLFFYDARSRKQQLSTTGTAAAPAAPPGGLTLGQAFKDHRIVRIGLAIFLASTTGAAVTVFLVPMVTKAGITRTEAALIASLFGVSAFAGKLIAGWLMDRFTTTLIPFAAFALPTVGYFLLWQSPGSLALTSTAALINGFGGGASLPITTYLITRYAGVRHFGKIFGIVSSLLGLAGGLGPLLAGFVFDATGDHAALMLIGAGVALLSGFVVFGLGPYVDYPPEGATEAGATVAFSTG